MSPRNNRTRILFFIFVCGMAWFYGFSPAHADNPVIGFYQKYISAVDGHRCPMYPSCSAYANQALETHGPVLGWIMACDRLVRCGRDEISRSPVLSAGNREYAYDPVEANDFWWFEKNK